LKFENSSKNVGERDGVKLEKWFMKKSFYNFILKRLFGSFPAV